MNEVVRKYLDNRGKRVAHEIRNLCEINVNDRTEELVFFLIYSEFKAVFNAGFNAAIDDMFKFVEEREN